MDVSDEKGSLAQVDAAKSRERRGRAGREQQDRERDGEPRRTACRRRASSEGTRGAPARVRTRRGRARRPGSRYRARAPATRRGTGSAAQATSGSVAMAARAEPRAAPTVVAEPGSNEDVASTARIATSAPQPSSESTRREACDDDRASDHHRVAPHGRRQDQVDVAVLEVTPEHVRRHDEIGEQRQRNGRIAPAHSARDEGKPPQLGASDRVGDPRQRARQRPTRPRPAARPATPPASDATRRPRPDQSPDHCGAASPLERRSRRSSSEPAFTDRRVTSIPSATRAALISLIRVPGT